MRRRARPCASRSPSTTSDASASAAKPLVDAGLPGVCRAAPRAPPDPSPIHAGSGAGPSAAPAGAGAAPLSPDPWDPDPGAAVPGGSAPRFGPGTPLALSGGSSRTASAPAAAGFSQKPVRTHSASSSDCAQGHPPCSHAAGSVAFPGWWATADSYLPHRQHTAACGSCAGAPVGAGAPAHDSKSHHTESNDKCSIARLGQQNL